MSKCAYVCETTNSNFCTLYRKICTNCINTNKKKNMSNKKETFDLLIVYKNDKQVLIKDVSSYMVSDGNDMFSFVKEWRRSFVPAANVKYFGMHDHYYNF